MKIQDIYEEYKIMPQLQLHQLRVAGVASIIADHYKENLNNDAIVSAALLHDMGNIIKFDLKLFPEHLQPKGLEYWEKLKEKFSSEYGDDEHEATYKIAEELKVSTKVMKLLKAYGFSKGKNTSEIENYEIKITAYSDHRVSADGVEPLMDRFREKMNRSSEDFIDYMNSMIPYWVKVEKQIFSNCKITPDYITDKKVESLINELKDYEI